MEQEEKYKGKRRTRDEEEILASATRKGRALEIWADKDGKCQWDMQVAMELIMQALELRGSSRCPWVPVARR